MLDDIISRKISKGEETFTLPPQPMNASQALDKKSSKQQNKWYCSDSGARFFQVLNCKLEDIIDTQTTIEKTLTGNCVTFSCRRNNCPVDLTFPEDFPNSDVNVVMMSDVPCASSSKNVDRASLRKIEWNVTITGQNSDEAADMIVQSIKGMLSTDRHP
jgi:hypothetical protein